MMALPPSGPGPGARGFNLVELMIVLAILAVLLMLAAPGFQSSSLTTNIKRYASDLRSSALLARGEAIKRNAPMRLCASADGSSCAASGNWDQGWIVLDPNDRVVSHHQSVRDGYQAVETGAASISLDFQPSGIASSPATIKICRDAPSVGKEAREVRISATGRPSVQAVQTTTCP